MPKPTTKKELLDACALEYSSLLELVGGYSPVEVSRAFPAEMLNRNVRDVLAHLHHWHLLLLQWHADAQQGIHPEMPAKGFNWNETPALNRKINQTYAKSSLSTIQNSLDTSHVGVIELIHLHSNKELFTRRYFDWTGSTSLGAYIISNSSSHYGWARRLILKTLNRPSA